MNEKIKAIQGIIGTTPDGVWGPKSQAAFDVVVHGDTTIHHGKASSFADPKDVAAFRRCKERGGTDQQCFKVGDNGIGCWGDDVTGATPACALPPDDMISKWGSVLGAKHKGVEVTVDGQTVLCILKDRMPWKKNINNEAIIDLNPGACAALGLDPPIMVKASWKWA